MAKNKSTETPATQWLRGHGILFDTMSYDYIDHGGSAEAAKQMGVDEHQMIKTLVMQGEHEQPLVILMHGDWQVSTKNLARQIGAKNIMPCKPEVAQRHSGYMVGGTSPFGLRKSMPVYAEQSILDLPEMYINGGKRGFILKLNPQILLSHLNAKLVQCGLLND
ncbi:MAG: aminoacyl-tRNA deacylase [Saezia sp.]